MHTATLITFTATAALAAPNPNTTSTQLNTAGFLNPQITYSQGGHAICVSGTIQVAASSNANVHLNIPSNLTADQTTQIIVDLTSANASTFIETTAGANATVGGIWNISSRLCFPKDSFTNHSLASTPQVQLLSHGIGFDQSYWDFPVPGNDSGAYSYVDYAAQQNKTTFTYDRLGIASSDHPDPIQTVQGPLEAEILHSLVTALRVGSIGNVTFESVVGVGHSFGSQLTGAVARKYPDDFDALVLTGFSYEKPGGPQFTSALNLMTAANLSAGYLVPTTRFGIQYSFFSYPDFEDVIVEAALKTAQTTTIGEQMSMSRISGVVANFTRPVYIVNGEKDLLFCDASCTTTDSQGRDVPAATLAQLFPAADAVRSGTYLLEDSGHGLNLAANVGVAFEVIQRWISGL